MIDVTRVMIYNASERIIFHALFSSKRCLDIDSFGWITRDFFELVHIMFVTRENNQLHSWPHDNLIELGHP